MIDSYYILLWFTITKVNLYDIAIGVNRFS